jgi:eukaryotic-like serine/threonine-protein kinase
MASEKADNLGAGNLLGRYRIVEKIGAGGMGEVYLAEDTTLERAVALKVLLAEIAGDEDRVRRFVQEAKAASALNHPNILTVYEIGSFENSRFIATELIKGKTLRERLQGEPLNLRETLDAAVQIASALNAAHSAGIVHRDIKPENVMLRDDGLVKVLDFGLAKLTEKKTVNLDTEGETRAQVKTSPGMVMGTVQYMSPEQTRGKETDARSDIWSLGVVIYEMLTRKTPFESETTNDTIAAILTREAAPLEAENTPTELQRIIRKALQKNRDERYQTIKDFLLDVKNLKRELEFAEELERSQIPGSMKALNVRTNQSDENPTSILPATTPTQNSLRPQISSAEYIVSEVKKHKRGALLGSLVLLGLIIAGGWFFFFRESIANSPIDSIAVLPFQNRNSDADNEYLLDGLAESLIYRLSQLPNLKVSPTSSVFRYKGKETDAQKIGAELSVSAVMTGRIFQRGDNLTISVELVDVRNNKLIWGEQYERKMSELLTTQREIAAVIIQKLQLKLSSGERALTKKYTDNSEAYQLYLKGRFHFAKRTKEDILKSIELFREAIKLDPNFALAYVGVGESYAVIPSYPYMSPAEAMPQSKAAIAKALELDPELPEAHTVAAMNAATYDWDWAEAERRFKRSLELNPNLAITYYRYGWTYLSPLGRHDLAIAEMRRAMELEPLSLQQGANFAAVLMYARQFDAALEQAKKTYDLDPNHIGGQFWMCHTLNAKGMYAESLSISEKSLQTNELMLAQAGYAYAKSGQRQKAKAVITRLKEIEKTRYVMNSRVAMIYAALGERDAAFAELEKAYQARDWFLPRLKVDPFMDNLRGDARFKEMLKRMKLPE